MSTQISAAPAAIAGPTGHVHGYIGTRRARHCWGCSGAAHHRRRTGRRQHPDPRPAAGITAPVVAAVSVTAWSSRRCCCGAGRGHAVRLALARLAGADGRADERTMVTTTWFWLVLLLWCRCSAATLFPPRAVGTPARRLDPYVVGPVENPEHLVGQRERSGPPPPHRTARRSKSGGPVRDHAGGQQRHREDHPLLRLCMLPGLVLLLWAARGSPQGRCQRRHRAVDLRTQPAGDHPPGMGGVRNEMPGGPHDGRDRTHALPASAPGIALVATAVAVKLIRIFRSWSGYDAAVARFVTPAHADRPGVPDRRRGVRGDLHRGVRRVVLAGRCGPGRLTALAGSVKIVNWLTILTAVANMTNAIGGTVLPVNFYAVLDVTRTIGVGGDAEPAAAVVAASGTPTGRGAGRDPPGRWR